MTCEGKIQRPRTQELLERIEGHGQLAIKWLIEALSLKAGEEGGVQSKAERESVSVLHVSKR